MSKDDNTKPVRPIDDIMAGDAFRKTILVKADCTGDGYPKWHGWAIMDAFLAGAEYGRNNPKEPKSHV